MAVDRMHVKSLKLIFPLMFVLCAGALRAAPAGAAALSPEQVLDSIYKQFHGQNMKTMVYDEVRTVSRKMLSRSEGNGMMPMDEGNAVTYVTRVYYRAPDMHGYRMLSEQIPGFWPGTPSQENSIIMDERWLERVRESYTLNLSKDATYAGKRCYVLNLIPKPGTAWTLNMTWYIDQQQFLILKFIHLVQKSAKRATSTTGELKYGKVRGHMVPLEARWRATGPNIPAEFVYEVKYKNYIFNVPLDESVFKREPMPPTQNEAKGK
jgi:hypothetical protein